MDYVLLALTVVSTAGAVVSAWVAWRQRCDARAAAEEACQSAADAQSDREKTVEAAQRVADAHERLAAIEEDRQQAAVQQQAGMIRLRGSSGAGGRGHVRIDNTSDEPIYDVQIHSITALDEDGSEIAVEWEPNPYMTPKIRVHDRVDAHKSREIHPFFRPPVPEKWSPIVIFRDARGRWWQMNLEHEVEPFDC